MASARTIRTWSAIHTWTSLICMLFMLMLCVTGLPLIFHEEIEHLLEDEVAVPAMPAGTPDLSLDRVIAAAQQHYPAEIVLFAALSRDHPNIITVGTSPVAIPPPGQFRRVLLDSRTASILGEEPAQSGVMDVILKIHKDMFAGLPGELFLGAMGIVFVLSVVSGIVVYGPFMRRIAFGTIRKDKSARVKWLDTHNLLGIVTVIWLIVVGITGTINTLAVPLFDLWRAQVLPGLLAPYKGQPLVKAGSVQSVVDVVRAALPDTIVTNITMPTPARFGTPRHFVVWTKGTTPFTARMFTPVLVDAQSGALTVAPDMPWYLRALQISRPLHFGDYGGLPLKILWALLDVMAIIVLISGLYLWWKRVRASPARLASANSNAISAA
jgi:uncharacterized iron-regulated membrane protein